MNIFLGTVLFSSAVFAAPSVDPIYDGEFNMDGKACVVTTASDETLIYDDAKTARIKVDKKIIELVRSATSGAGSFECGKTFTYEGRGSKTRATVKLAKKEKAGNCLATLEVTGEKGKTTLPPRPWSCHD